MRFLPGGTVDSSFGVGGTVKLGLPYNYESWLVRVMQLLAKSDGSVIAIAQQDATSQHPQTFMVRLNEDGSRNNDMYDDMVLPLNVPRSSVLMDGQRIAIVGWRTATTDYWGNPASFAGVVMRRKADGRPDPTFARGRGFIENAGFFDINPKTPSDLMMGIATEAKSLIRLPGNRLLVGGRHLDRFMVMRVTAAGQPDHTFGTDRRRGRTIVNFGGRHCNCISRSEMARDSKHRIVQVGYASYPFRYRRGSNNGRGTTVLVRYRQNGKIDRTFGRNGFAFPPHRTANRPTSIAIQKNNRILVTFVQGYTRIEETKFMVARYLPNGRLDRSFFGDGKYIWKTGTASTASKVLIDDEGRALVAGGAAIGDTGNYVLKRFLAGN